MLQRAEHLSHTGHLIDSFVGGEVIKNSDSEIERDRAVIEVEVVVVVQCGLQML